MASNYRVDYVDIAKGISIMLVALFHSKLKFIFPEVIQPMGLFRLPLFFFLSGIFSARRHRQACLSGNRPMCC